jgi:hypothetical protein
MQEQINTVSKESTGGTPAPQNSVWDMPVPEGYVRNAQGHLVHESAVSEADAMRSRLVSDLVVRAISEADAVRGFVAKAYEELAAFCQVSAERFGVAWGETNSFTMTSICGRFKVQCDVDQGVAVNECAGAAKTLLDECLAEWTAGGKPQAVALLANTFRPTRNGKLSLTRLFDLLRNRNLPEFKEEEKFQRLCDALEAAIQTTGKRRYMRFYARRTPADKWGLVEFGN